MSQPSYGSLNWSTPRVVLTALSGQPLKSRNCQQRKYDRLRRVHPKPNVSPTVEDQPSRRIMRPNQGKKCKVTDDVGHNGRKRRVGEIRRRAKRDAHKKVHQQLWPQDAMSEVRQGKHEGGDGYRDRTAKLPFEGDLKVPAKPSLLHEWRNQGAHQNHEGDGHAGIARHI